MKKWLVGGLGAIVVITGAAAGGLLLSNKQVDDAVAHVQQLNSANVEVQILFDNDSLLRRELILGLSVTEAEQSLNLVLENVITKRPWGTQVEHTVRFDQETVDLIDMPALRQLVQSKLVDQPVLTGQTSLFPSGKFNSDLVTQAVDEQLDVVSLKISPMHFNAHGKLHGNQQYAMTWPGFSLHIDELEAVKLTLHPISFNAKGTALGASLFAGVQSLAGEGFTLQSESQWQQSQVFFGSFQIESLGEVVNDRYQGELTALVDQVVINNDDTDMTLTEFKLASAMSGIDVANYQLLADALNRVELATNDLAEVKTAASALMKDGFEFSINELSAKVGGEAFNLSASVALPENKIADLNNPFSLLGLITLISAESQMRFAMALEEDPQMSDAIMMLMMSGGLIVDGSDYVMDFSFRDGQALLNGQPMKLPL